MARSRRTPGCYLTHALGAFQPRSPRWSGGREQDCCILLWRRRTRLGGSRQHMGRQNRRNIGAVPRTAEPVRTSFPIRRCRRHPWQRRLAVSQWCRSAMGVVVRRRLVACGGAASLIHGWPVAASLQKATPIEKGPIIRPMIQNQEPMEFHMARTPCSSTMNAIANSSTIP